MRNMGLRSSLGRAVTNGLTVFNQEIQVGLAEYQARVEQIDAQRRAKHIESRITGDYTPTTRSSRKVTFS